MAQASAPAVWVSMPARSRRLTRKAFILALYVALAVVLLTPVFWMVSTSLKYPNQIFSLPIKWLPTPLTLQNYPAAWRAYDFNRFLLNSLFVTSVVTASQVLLASAAGYGLAKFRFKGRQLLLIAILSTIMLPIEVIMVPLYLEISSAGWQSSYQALILPSIADAFGVFLMRQFMLSLPDEIFDAARMDGAGELAIFFRIVLPLSVPALATLAIFVWRETWDDFVWPYIVISDNAHRTFPLGVALFQASEQTNYGQLMAIATLATIPPAIVFFAFQRAFVRSVAVTGLKGGGG
ncbi:MAG: carbohydrate ABC transporter permease [Candidatus Dormibacteraceae bacterium]